MLPADPMSIPPHPRAAAYALQQTQQPVIAELLQSSFPAAVPRAAACLPVRQGPALNGERPRLRIIQDPISRLNPEMLYRQIQYLVEEDDWSRQGEEVNLND